MQPWEKERFGTETVSIRKKLKDFGCNSIFAFTCVGTVYACILKKTLSGMIKRR